jgi:hypothetical protein
VIQSTGELIRAEMSVPVDAEKPEAEDLHGCLKS